MQGKNSGDATLLYTFGVVESKASVSAAETCEVRGQMEDDNMTSCQSPSHCASNKDVRGQGRIMSWGAEDSGLSRDRKRSESDCDSIWPSKDKARVLASVDGIRRT